MKLIIFFIAALSAASSDPIHSTQPTDHFASNVETYQSTLEQQQQGIYGDQSHYSPVEYSQPQASYSQQAIPSGQASFAGQSILENGHGFVQNYQPQRSSAEKSARIISFQNENKGNNYQYSYETENGIKVQERGQSNKGTQAHGGYSYTGDDGKVYSVTYTADENGFRPQGAHLPTPPPIPEAIANAIEQNAKDQANGVFDDGSYKEQTELQQYQHQQQQVQVPVQHVQSQVQVQQSQEYQYENQGYQQEYQPEYQQDPAAAGW